MRFADRRTFVRAGARFAMIALLAAACSRGAKVETDDAPRPEPIPIRVRNENFLDMNVSIVTGGATRRLGQVAGNSTANFRINWNVANGQAISVVAVPIGQNARYTSPSMSVQPGQMIEVRLAAVLRQSTTVVREP